MAGRAIINMGGLLLASGLAGQAAAGQANLKGEGKE